MPTTTEVPTPVLRSAIARRIQILLAHENSSARFCGQEALNHLCEGKPLSYAGFWTTRGAQHAFGWPTNNPEGW